MADERYGPWASLTIDEARHELADCPASWWFTGGIALELFAGRSWRGHDDLDVGIPRRDAVTVLDHLRRQGWDLVVAAAGTIAPWEGGELAAALHQNNVWCRRSGGPWQLDVTVGDGNDEQWVYRRNRALVRPWPEAVREVDGVRFFAPELQLLFKSDEVRSKDTFDAEQVVPLLDGGGLALFDRPAADGPSVATARSRPRPGVCRRRRSPRARHPPSSRHRGMDRRRVGRRRARGRPDPSTQRPRPRGDPASFDPALRALAEHGFRTVRDDGRHNQVLADPAGRIVDLHAFDPNVVTVGRDGIRRHGGDGLAYEADGFDGDGAIDGSAVRCVSPTALVRYHTGYDIDADDWHDVRLLCDRFDLPIPPDYEPFRSP